MNHKGLKGRKEIQDWRTTGRVLCLILSLPFVSFVVFYSFFFRGRQKVALNTYSFCFRSSMSTSAMSAKWAREIPRSIDRPDARTPMTGREGPAFS